MGSNPTPSADSNRTAPHEQHQAAFRWVSVFGAVTTTSPVSQSMSSHLSENTSDEHLNPPNRESLQNVVRVCRRLRARAGRDPSCFWQARGPDASL